MAKAKAVKKKRNPGRNKKKIATKKVQLGPLEFQGYKIGQEVWVMMPIMSSEEWAFGTISQFHPGDKQEPSFSFFDKVKRRYAIGAVSRIAESPPKKWLAKI